MKICVPIKQVPETSEVKMDEETGTMIREGVTSIINPLDLYAIEAAIELKEKWGGEITTITMGPPSSISALREAIAMGCDQAIQLSNKRFAGADTWATAYVLAQAIRKMSHFDLILCGERATDGDTGQVGPGIASFLDLPLATYVSEIYDLNQADFRVKRLVEGGYEILKLPFPALLTVVKEISYPRLPTLRGKQRAKTVDIPCWGPEDIAAESDSIGLNGSPTRVVKISRPRVSRHCEKITIRDEEELDPAVDKLIDFLQKRELI